MEGEGGFLGEQVAGTTHGIFCGVRPVVPLPDSWSARSWLLWPCFLCLPARQLPKDRSWPCCPLAPGKHQGATLRC